MNVYCITGYPGSGKSTATEYLSDKIPVVVMGDIVRELAKKNANISEENGRDIGEWATEHREEYGKTVFAEKTCERIQSEYSDSDKLVIDGIRSLQELHVFEQNFETVITIYIHAPFEVRYNRITERGRDAEEENYSKETLQQRDQQEKQWGLDGIVDQADRRIENTDSLEDFYNQLDSVLQL